MIDLIFKGLMAGIAGILEFIVVAGFIGLFLMLPFLLKGGWILGIVIYGFIVPMFIMVIIEAINQSKKDDEE